MPEEKPKEEKPASEEPKESDSAEEKTESPKASAEEGKKEIEDILAEPEKEDIDIEEAVSDPDDAESAPEKPEEPEKETLPEKEKEKNDPSANAQDDAKASEEKPAGTEEKPFKEDKDELEKAVEESTTESEEEPKKDGKKKFNWKILLIVLATALVTAAVALGAAWYFMNRKAAEKTEEPKTETPASEETNEPTTSEKFVYVNAADGLRLRETPDVNGKILETMPFGTKLEVLETKGDWIKTTYNNKTGWCMVSYTSAENPLVYKNADYKFEITFNSAWAGYKLFPIKVDSTETAAWYIAIPTTDAAYISTGTDKGYASMFAISVYTPAQWTATQAAEGQKPILAVQNSSYVIAYSTPNGIPPKDLTARATETKSIIATIKFY